MPQDEIARSRRWRALLGALAVSCLALQPVALLVHVALHEHTVGHAGSHAAGSHAHLHLPEHGADHDHDDGHPPHPVEDHLVELAFVDGMPTLPALAIAALPGEASLPPPASRRGALIEPCDADPRSPPDRRPSAPRAPPLPFRG